MQARTGVVVFGVLAIISPGPREFYVPRLMLRR